MRRRLVPLLAALLLALSFVAPVEAHANLVQSNPPIGAVLDAAPAVLVLEFSEELDPGFSEVQLYNGNNELVNTGESAVDPVTPRVLSLVLGDLPKDSYTAIWRVRSAVDGHVTRGSVPFGVGVAANTTSLIPPLGAPEPATMPPPPLDTTLRWLNLLLAAVAFGGLPFGLFVWRPAWRAACKRQATGGEQPGAEGATAATGDQSASVLAEQQLIAADERMTRTIRWLIIAGVGLFLLTNILFLIEQAAIAAGVPLAQALGRPILQLLGGRSGQLWVGRVVLAFQIGVLAWRLPPVGHGVSRLWWIMTAIAGVLLLTFSLNSHGAAAPEGAALAVALDWLHLAAMVAWLGGLVPLSMAIAATRRQPEAALPLSAIVPRFSRLALVSVVVLTLTGVYSYILHVNELELLAATTYGRALMVKLGLFVLLLVVAGLNLFVLSRRLRSLGNRLAGAFRRNVRAELVAGALLLLAVGAMTSVAPSKVAWEEQQRLGIKQQAEVDGVQLTLRIAPAQIGDNEFAVDVVDPRPGAPEAPSTVLLRFGMVGMDMGNLQTEASETGAERYTSRGSYTSMGGRWQIEVILRRDGFDDVRHTFAVDIVRMAPQVGAVEGNSVASR